MISHCQEAERRKHEAQELQQEVVSAREAERAAKGKLMEFLTTAIQPGQAQHPAAAVASNAGKDYNSLDQTPNRPQNKST